MEQNSEVEIEMENGTNVEEKEEQSEKETQIEEKPEKETCPSCGKTFKRLNQHKCKVKPQEEQVNDVPEKKKKKKKKEDIPKPVKQDNQILTCVNCRSNSGSKSGKRINCDVGAKPASKICNKYKKIR